MNPEQQRIRIAEACGWVRKDESYPYAASANGICKSIVWYSPIGKPQPLGDDAIPDYLNDLNAMAAAEKVLTQQQDFYYRTYALPDVCKDGSGMLAITATAAQRSEAFLRALGKWEESA